MSPHKAGWRASLAERIRDTMDQVGPVCECKSCQRTAHAEPAKHPGPVGAYDKPLGWFSWNYCSQGCREWKA